MRGDIDLRLLEIFCCVYEKRSLTEATKCLHTSQSTLSFHIKNLENQVGQKLFYRKGRSLVPTTIADRLYDYAKELMDFKLRLIEDIGRFSGKRRGMLRIGASTIPANHILPELLGEFMNSFNGDFQIDLIVGDSASIFRQVQEGKLDIGIVGYLADKSLDFLTFYEDRIWAVGNPELGDKTYTVDELKELPLLIREKGSGTRSVVEEVLRRRGLSIKQMNVIATLESNEAIRKMLRYVNGYSFLSNFVVRDDDFLIKLKVSGLEPIVRKFFLIKDRNRPLSKTVHEAIDFLILRAKTLF
ncbi:MAG: LysR family transcriptional regulator [Aquificae bacterium]|nr:LysR family transcriptional regulator [Aquificota bacterium]